MSIFSRSFTALAAAAALSFAVSTITPSFAKDEPEKPKRCKDGKKKCHFDDMTDQEIYYSGYWLARTGEYAAALDMLNKAKVKDERILTYIGFATRKLGDFDRAMGFYTDALALNPNYTVARAYLGEAWLGKGDISKAKEQLSEIANRCGTGCTDHVELKAEIEKAQAVKG